MGTAKTQRTKKGDISISQTGETIRLRWRYNGNRYTLSPQLPYTALGIERAKIISQEIKLDIAKGVFDTSLVKYMPNATTIPVKQKQQENHINSKDLTESYKQWAIEYRHGNLCGNNDYTQILNMFAKWVKEPNFTINKIPSILSSENFSYTTYNRRLSNLFEFFQWYRPDGNPLKGVNRRRKPQTIKSLKREPLSRDEIKKILSAIKTDKFCHSSTYAHSHYYSFLFTMFCTGLRNEEAIGLRVKNLNFNKNLMHVEEVLARAGKTSNAKNRIRKNTKNDKERDIPIAKKLKGLLVEQCKGKHPDDLVFTSVNGLSIDDKMFQRRVFRPVLEELEIPIRDLYCCRHSFASHAIDQGIPPATVALLMGSTVRTIITRYVHPVGVPTIVPDII